MNPSKAIGAKILCFVPPNCTPRSPDNPVGSNERNGLGLNRTPSILVPGNLIPSIRILKLEASATVPAEPSRKDSLPPQLLLEI